MDRLSRIPYFLFLMILIVATPVRAEGIKLDPPQAVFDTEDDPLEDLNREIFDVNDFMDRLLFRPLAELYRVMIPPFFRDRIGNVVSNMGEPVNLLNNILQGDMDKAGTTLSRFLINTTVGLGGTFEVANDYKLLQQNADFGQTLAIWGIKPGPYLVLPLLGPSNFRDAIGTGVDMVSSPWTYVTRDGGRGTANAYTYSSFAMGGIVKREQNIEAMDALKSGSLDYYAQMRAVFRQYRAKQVGDTIPELVPHFEDEYE